MITDSSCSGKTTVIEELDKERFPVLRETTREITAKMKHISVSKGEPQIRQDLIFNE